MGVRRPPIQRRSLSLKDALLDLFGFTPPPAPEPKRAPKPRAAPGRRSAAPPPDGAPAARDEAATLAVVNSAGAGFRRVVFTRNRRVMASVAGRGEALRLNAAFASAPEEVLAAVAALFSARDRRKRNRAREAVRRFVASIPAQPAGPRRARRAAAGDGPRVERLRAEFERVNREHFGGSLPEVPIHLSGRMRSRNGHFSSHPPEIVLNRRLCTHAAPGEAERTLRHEMIHLWQHASGKKPDHGREFRAWARRLGVHPRATRPVSWERE